MKLIASTSRSDLLVRRVRIVAAGLACGLLFWCALRTVPKAFGQVGFPTMPPCVAADD